MYDLARLDRELAGTIFAGKVSHCALTGSTNADAMAAAQAHAPHGAVFLADEQSAGRGRGDHSWHAPAGQGLYVSVLLRLELPAVKLPLLPLAVGLAASDAIGRASGCRTELRWPNDGMIGQRKVCGISADSKSEHGRVPYVVVGIGVNVHQREFPGELQEIATSLRIETGRSISRQELLVLLLKSLQREIRELELPRAVETIPRRLAEASSWVRGKRVAVHGPQACQGVTEGLDENGFLLVRTAGGLVRVQTGGIRATERDEEPCC